MTPDERRLAQEVRELVDALDYARHVLWDELNDTEREQESDDDDEQR